eukprot:5580847-Amphidinium_carterae.2
MNIIGMTRDQDGKGGGKNTLITPWIDPCQAFFWRRCRALLCQHVDVLHIAIALCGGLTVSNVCKQFLQTETERWTTCKQTGQRNVPPGTGWDHVRSLFLGAYTSPGAGISKYSEPKRHLLPSLHAFGRTRDSGSIPTSMLEYTSRMDALKSLPKHVDEMV